MDVFVLGVATAGTVTLVVRVVISAWVLVMNPLAFFAGIKIAPPVEVFEVLFVLKVVPLSAAAFS